MNHKRVYRIYRAEGLAVRRRKRKRMAVGLRTVLPPPTRPNERWSMDFTLDTLASGRRFRTFNIVDDFTRECVAIEVDTSIGGARVVRVLERLLATRGPADIGTGNDCPLPLRGTAARRCNFSLCDLSCLGGLVCPDGMECLGGSDCRWPAP